MPLEMPWMQAYRETMGLQPIPENARDQNKLNLDLDNPLHAKHYAFIDRMLREYAEEHIRFDNLRGTENQFKVNQANIKELSYDEKFDIAIKKYAAENGPDGVAAAQTVLQGRNMMNRKVGGPSFVEKVVTEPYRTEEGGLNPLGFMGAGLGLVGSLKFVWNSSMNIFQKAAVVIAATLGGGALSQVIPWIGRKITGQEEKEAPTTTEVERATEPAGRLNVSRVAENEKQQTEQEIPAGLLVSSRSAAEDTVPNPFPSAVAEEATNVARDSVGSMVDNKQREEEQQVPYDTRSYGQSDPYKPKTLNYQVNYRGNTTDPYFEGFIPNQRPVPVYPNVNGNATQPFAANNYQTSFAPVSREFWHPARGFRPGNPYFGLQPNGGIPYSASNFVNTYQGVQQNVMGRRNYLNDGRAANLLVRFKQQENANFGTGGFENAKGMVGFSNKQLGGNAAQYAGINTHDDTAYNPLAIDVQSGQAPLGGGAPTHGLPDLTPQQPNHRWNAYRT